MKSKIEELLLSKDKSNHKLGFAIISGDKELIDEYSRLFADEILRSNFEYNKRYWNYRFIESFIYSVRGYSTTEFCDWKILRLERSRFGTISLDSSPYSGEPIKNIVSIYSNDKFLTSCYDSEKEELTKTLITWFISFFKSYTE